MAAYRSLSADKIGWYQCKSDSDSKGATSWKIAYYAVPDGFGGGDGRRTQLTVRNSSRFWATGSVDKKGALMITDTYTGQTV